jgi:hypothetical protein
MLRGVIVAAVGLILLVVGTGVGFLGARHGWWYAETAAALPTISPAPSTPIASDQHTHFIDVGVPIQRRRGHEAPQKRFMFGSAERHSVLVWADRTVRLSVEARWRGRCRWWPWARG